MAHHPFLTAEEERQLAPTNPGDTQAHQALVLHKKRYIDIVSSSSLLGSLKIQPTGSAPGRSSAGGQQIGLMRTASKFDCHKGINEPAAEMELKPASVRLIRNLKTRMISLDHPQES